MKSDIISQHYPIIKNFDFIEIEGYANTNYRVEKHNKPAYILKEYPYTDEVLKLCTAETEVLMHLSSTGRYFPVPVKNKKGHYITILSAQNKIYRLLTWLDGDFFNHVDHTPALLESLGEFLGRLDSILQGIRNPAIESRRFSWDLQYLTDIAKWRKYITDHGTGKLIDYFLMQFRENALPVLPHLRRSIIHNDMNERNILVKNDTIAGIIDFGDLVYAPLIQELAVCLTYVILDKEDPLAAASLVVESYSTIIPLEREETDILYYLIGGRLCMSLLNAAYAKSGDSHNPYLSVSEKQVKRMISKWLLISPEKAMSVFRKSAGLEEPTVKKLNESLEKRNRFISSAQSVSYTHPIKMQRAAFQYMYDSFGNTFLDAYNNIPHVGHAHPRVVEAGQRQMARLNTNTRYIYDELADYAEKLLSKFPDKFNKVFFVNSGSAASDLAIRMAQVHTGHKDIMVIEHGYHGNTRLGIDISHYKFERKGGKGQAENILVAPIPDVYRCNVESAERREGQIYADQAGNIIEKSGKKVAAFIAEPIVGCAGQVPLAPGYLERMYPIIREQGGVCISDEVQTGFGRMGSSFWGFELHNVEPDLVVLGKPMGNGHPIGAVVTTDEIADSFDNGMEFFSSFGGNPVSCAIGMAVLDVIHAEHLQQNALETGAYFIRELKKLQEKYLQIGDVRGYGLFLGIEFVKDRQLKTQHTGLANHLKNKLREKFILVSTDGPFENIIKMKPPLCFNKENVDQVIQSMDKILGDI